MNGSKDTALWIWKKRVPLAEEPIWEEKLEGMTNAVWSAIGDPAFGEDTGYAEISAYCDSKADAESLRTRFGGKIGREEDRDWVAESARSEPPLVIRDALVVTQEVEVAALEEVSARFPGRTVLSVPAQMAFGTGQHETTSTCLRMLADIGKVRGSEWSMLDIGTGSGLLALGARSCGAGKGKVDAFDFDAKAVEIAEENAARNGITGIRFWMEDVLKWKPSRRYDVIAANLYSGLLEKALPKMRRAAAPDADLILSGILRSQLDDVLAAAERSGFSVVKTVCRGKWAGVRMALTRRIRGHR